MIDRKAASHFLAFASLPNELEQGELLELLLRYCEPEAEQQAADLLSHYGDLANLLDATKEDLRKHSHFRGDGFAMLRLIAELHRRYIILRSHRETLLTGTASFQRYFLAKSIEDPQDGVYLLSLSPSRSVLDCTLLCKGKSRSEQLSLRSIAEIALQHNASSVILCYFRPHHMPLFHPEDLDFIHHFRDMLTPLNISMLDCFMFSQTGFLSYYDTVS